jgi:hypothetical protein
VLWLLLACLRGLMGHGSLLLIAGMRARCHYRPKERRAANRPIGTEAPTVRSRWLPGDRPGITRLAIPSQIPFCHPTKCMQSGQVGGQLRLV